MPFLQEFYHYDYQHRLLLALALSVTLASGATQAAGLMDSLSSAAGELSKSGGESGGGMSLSSLTGLLNGGDKALSSSSMTNAAGILQYCVKNNVLSANGAEGVKDQLLSKLGITSTETPRARIISRVWAACCRPVKVRAWISTAWAPRRSPRR